MADRAMWRSGMGCERCENALVVCVHYGKLGNTSALSPLNFRMDRESVMRLLFSAIVQIGLCS